MGRQLKRKDPNKKKKAVDNASTAVADKQPEKNNAFSMAKPGASSRKNAPVGFTRKSVKPVREPESGIRGYFDKSVQFLREVRVELKKVTWPSRKQTIGSTAVVLLMVIMVSIFLGIVDFGLSSLIRLVIG
jgi:preprotein translocase subunit SecE